MLLEAETNKYCPGGNDFGAISNLKTWVLNFFLVWLWIARRKNLKTFLPITFKNSASVQYCHYCASEEAAGSILYTLILYIFYTIILKDSHVFFLSYNLSSPPNTPVSSYRQCIYLLTKRRKESTVIVLLPCMDRSVSYSEWGQIPHLYCWKEYMLSP